MSANSKYPLGRDYVSATRLNLQHYALKDTLNYSLHPRIPVDNPNIKIADVGTGTGIWLCDLARTLPSTAQLDGFDISGDQFPVAGQLPSNVKLYEKDAMEEPPQHLQGQYDIVHLRLFMSSVLKGDPAPVIRHCSKLLKPGGYLQWVEYNLEGYRAISTDGSPKENIEKFLALSVKMMERNDRPMHWIKELPQHFEHNGFAVQSIESHREQPWQLRMYTEGFCILADEFATSFFGRYDQIGGGNELRKMAQDMFEEARQGSAISQLCQVVVGVKIDELSRFKALHD